MKQKCKIILTLFLFLLVFTIKAQEYLPFPNDSAVWHSVYSYPSPDPPYIYYQTYSYEAKGDTIIDSKEYTKLYWYPALNINYRSGYRGAYRIDVESERVYYIDKNYGTESILYDFSLIPGDTIVIDGTGYDPFNLVCYDTASILLNGFPHKQLFVYSYLPNGTECYTTWVKGIGSLRMPIETDGFCASSFEWIYDLTCFYYKDEQVYEWFENPYFEGCIGSNVGVEEYHLGTALAVAPNPAKNWTAFNYKLPDNAVEGVIKISDTEGRTVEVLDVYGNRGQKMWDTRNVKPGIYFYSFTANGMKESGKIVISGK
nr:T9SS type A sorting domain-containing protein [Bacteroidota bacterium]